jgi:hypothetical protein
MSCQQFMDRQSDCQLAFGWLKTLETKAGRAPCSHFGAGIAITVSSGPRFQRACAAEGGGRHLQQRGVKVSGGTIVNATMIAATSSIKSKDGERDPEMPHLLHGCCTAKKRATGAILSIVSCALASLLMVRSRLMCMQGV